MFWIDLLLIDAALPAALQQTPHPGACAATLASRHHCLTFSRMVRVAIKSSEKKSADFVTISHKKALTWSECQDRAFPVNDRGVARYGPDKRPNKTDTWRTVKVQKKDNIKSEIKP